MRSLLLGALTALMITTANAAEKFTPTPQQEIAAQRVEGCLFGNALVQLSHMKKPQYAEEAFLQSCKAELTAIGAQDNRVIMTYRKIYTDAYMQLMENVEAWHEMKNSGFCDKYKGLCAGR
jgi:hypothetical protein